jgi:hypothetical protein
MKKKTPAAPAPSMPTWETLETFMRTKMRIPLHREHPFQSIANADSEAWRTPIPGMANSHSGDREH